MDVTDPRERYDDLQVVRDEHDVDSDEFASLDDYEAYRSGWVVTALAVDDAGHVLLAYDGDWWFAPGGSVKPGESLRDAVVREVREETGVDVTPDRPYGVRDVVASCGDRKRSFSVVTFAATPETTRTGSDLGVDGEDVEDAAWFETLPGDTYEREQTAELLARVRD